MTRLATTTATLLLVGVAACGRPATPPPDLARDLEAAGASSGVELTPRAAGTEVVSAIEQSGAPRSAPAPKVAPRRVGAGDKRIARVVVDRAPDSAVVATKEPDAPTTVAVQAKSPTPDGIIPTPRPTPAPGAAPGHRRGGYSSVSDVIRRAPFPITP